MANDNKKPNLPDIQTTMSPIGTLVYPWLQKADRRFAKDNEAGEFSTILRVPKEDAECFMQDYFDLLEEAIEAVKETLPKPKHKTLGVRSMDTKGCAISTEYDDETGEETGNVLIRLSSRTMSTTLRMTRRFPVNLEL